MDGGLRKKEFQSNMPEALEYLTIRREAHVESSWKKSRTLNILSSLPVVTCCVHSNVQSVTGKVHVLYCIVRTPVHM
ncbi:unnamed protein product [Allacma fusca]|uniref:Uncharacterized protein n=1 Tax=Allacma fusca TaxID=39272 RepID=A0A8J2L678_9HEXA|nr:unnamed protein product [Allacma fusca]